MPNNNAWNGKWTGEDNLYVLVRSFNTKNSKAIAMCILEKGYFQYSFGDGWVAAVSVDEIDSKEAMRLKRKSQGFCGYNWMVDSIIDFLEILPSDERKRRYAEGNVQ